MIIYNNLMAENANRQLGINSKAQSKSMEKLSSGMRINRAGDDAAGLAISEKMRNQINGLHQASRNAQDGISLIQTAEGALGESQEMLARMRELSIQSMNDTYTDSDRDKLQLEVNQLLEEIDGIAAKTEFNEQQILYGDGTGDLTNINEEYAAAVSDAVDTLTNLAGQLDSDLGLSDPNSATQLAQYLSDMANNPDEFVADDGTPYYDLSLEDQLALYDKVKEPDPLATDTFSAVQTALAGSTTYTIEEFTNEVDSLTSAVKTAEEFEGFDYDISGVRVFEFQVGANQDQKISISIDAVGVNSLGLATVNVGTKETASAALEMIDAAVEQISQQRAVLGAVQNRLEHTIKNVDNIAENLQSAESNIRDTDMAEEMVELTKLNILTQASQSMLSQANQSPQQVLQLLN
ncbi:MAG: hypothetical protein BEN18_10160 [Epulopiscium sp. Nuni2H_MBin001]|nr:MAG: hypothetical protein BEN18_10160 [Epulopiscium sp. Nuni2H_MBin001]